MYDMSDKSWARWNFNAGCTRWRYPKKFMWNNSPISECDYYMHWDEEMENIANDYFGYETWNL